jgi:type VI secretion system protein ImpL
LQITGKYPFNPKGKAEATLAEVDSILKPKEGALWVFYDANLQKLMVKDGSRYVEAPNAATHLTPAFINFFNRAAAFSDGMYVGGSPDPHFTFSLTPEKTEGIDNIELEIDGQTLTYSGGAAVAKQFSWPGSPSDVKARIPPFSWSTHQGLWAAFRFFDDADEQTANGATVSYAWKPRSGKDLQPMLSTAGTPLVVRLELDMGSNPPVFQRGYLSGVTCVAEVAK